MPLLTDTTSNGVINQLKSQFARWGIPDHIRSDGGPQFSSIEFKKYCQEKEINHTKSSPHHPQGNGAAERAVQVAKRILSQEDSYTALLAYRCSPIDVTGYAPSQLIMGRMIKSELPLPINSLQPKWPNMVEVKENNSRAKLKSTENYNRIHGARKLPELPVDSQVRMKTDPKKPWSEKMDVKEQVTDRSYIVRNRKHLQSCPIDIEIFDESKHNKINDRDGGQHTTNVNSQSNCYGNRKSGRESKPVKRYGT